MTAFIGAAFLNFVLWGLFFGTRRATMHSAEMDQDIRRIFEGAKE